MQLQWIERLDTYGKEYIYVASRLWLGSTKYCHQWVKQVRKEIQFNSTIQTTLQEVCDELQVLKYAPLAYLKSFKNVATSSKSPHRRWSRPTLTLSSALNRRLALTPTSVPSWKRPCWALVTMRISICASLADQFRSRRGHSRDAQEVSGLAPG